MTGNMTTLEQDLKKQILGRSKAEKVFRPWWDTLEDYLLNSLVLLGKFNNLVQVLFIKTTIHDVCYYLPKLLHCAVQFTEGNSQSEP